MENNNRQIEKSRPWMSAVLVIVLALLFLIGENFIDGYFRLSYSRGFDFSPLFTYPLYAIILNLLIVGILIKLSKKYQWGMPLVGVLALVINILVLSSFFYYQYARAKDKGTSLSQLAEQRRNDTYAQKTNIAGCAELTEYNHWSSCVQNNLVKTESDYDLCLSQGEVFQGKNKDEIKNYCITGLAAGMSDANICLRIPVTETLYINRSYCNDHVELYATKPIKNLDSNASLYAPPTINPDNPVISNVQFSIEDGHATITWETDKPAWSLFTFGSDEHYGIPSNEWYPKEKKLATTHTATVPARGYEYAYHPGQKYHYQIFACSKVDYFYQNDCNATADATFVAQ